MTDHGNTLGPMRLVLESLFQESQRQVALAELPGVQGAHLVQAANLRTAGFALDKIQPEYMADFLADYLAGRFRSRAKAGIIGAQIARISETRK